MNKEIRKYMAEIGRKGGRAKSEAKAIASRKNGILAVKKKPLHPVEADQYRS